MSKKKDSADDEFKVKLDDIADVLAKEDQQINLAGGYIDFFAGISISSVDDLVEVIQESLDEYIGRRYALQVVEELNRYISTWGSFEENIRDRHRGNSSLYHKTSEIGDYINALNPIKNIWELRACKKEIFDGFLAVVSQDSPRVIISPTVARMALLRIYISNNAHMLVKKEKRCRCVSVDRIKYAFNIGAAMNELNLASQLLDKDTLKKLHTIGARANRTERESDKYKDLCSVARAAWDFDCDLLHTQMLYLFVANGNVALNSKGETSVKNKLKEIAPHNRVYGPGTKKIIDACPCDKSDQCPLIKKINPKMRYDLPVSKKYLK